VHLELHAGVDDVHVRPRNGRLHAVQLRLDVETGQRLDRDVGRQGRVGDAFVERGRAARGAVAVHFDLRLVHREAATDVDQLQIGDAEQELALEELQVEVALQVLAGG